MRQRDHPPISVHDTDLLNANVQLQLDGPADTHSGWRDPEELCIVLAALTTKPILRYRGGWFLSIHPMRSQAGFLRLHQALLLSRLVS